MFIQCIMVHKNTVIVPQRSESLSVTDGRVLLSSSAVTPGGGGGGGGEVWQPDPGDPSSLLPNCTPPAIEQFPPPPFFTPSQRRRGGVVVHALVACYMFVALALACDDYFVPACERLSDGQWAGRQASPARRHPPVVTRQSLPNSRHPSHVNLLSSRSHQGPYA